MKPPTNRTFALFACAGLLLATVIGATNQERIRWPFSTGKVTFSLGEEDGTKVEFGLRNDGVVVWREIKPAVTNSPAEREESGLFIMTNWIGTNIWMTNWYTFPNIILNGNTNGPTPLDLR